MEGYHNSTTSTVTPPADRRLGPYEYVATPPIQLVLNVILDRVDVGGCITPGVRQLADWSGVSRGQITAHLRQLDSDGWIAYDGRVIMLIRHPDESEGDRSVDRSPCENAHDVIDQLIDQPESAPECDRSVDRSLAQPLADRTTVRQHGPACDDRSTDRSAFHPDPHGIMTHEQQQTPVAVDLNEIPSGGMQGGGVCDRPADRSPAARLLAELGADEAIIADALRAVPGLTPQQVRDTWDWHAWRRERAPHLSEGVFFAAIRQGHIHAPPPDPRRPIAVETYLQADPAWYRRGDDLRDLPVAPPGPEPRDRPELRDLVPPPRPVTTLDNLPPVVFAPAYVPPKKREQRGRR